MQITMLDLHLNKIWDFFGKDIFTSCEVCEEKIKLYDWENSYYEIDFNGKIIT